jgi:next-to-BRCA1 protein 1
MSPQPVRHRASCDLCDSVIIGVRYKCLNCPDFDTCSSCFTVRQELHPEHGFVKVINLEDLLMRKASTQIPHRAHCDSCQKTIVGDRYKCMHPDCPDFDLCANCEALPIPVHPSTHPMLKVKTPNTMIPTVQRTAILPTATAAQALRLFVNR